MSILCTGTSFLLFYSTISLSFHLWVASSSFLLLSSASLAPSLTILLHHNVKYAKEYSWVWLFLLGCTGLAGFVDFLYFAGS